MTVVAFSTNLPANPDVKGVRYVKNHHYVEVELDDGTKHRCMAKARMRCRCPACEAVFEVESNLGIMCCPHCGAHPVEEQWGESQLCFLPDGETCVFRGDS